MWDSEDILYIGTISISTLAIVMSILLVFSDNANKNSNEKDCNMTNVNVVNFVRTEKEI